VKNRCPTCGQLISEPRSTGYRSQNSRVWGSCQAIAIQASNPKWTMSSVYYLMKCLAVQEGVYPGIKYGKNLIIPISQSLASKKEVTGLCEVINKFASDHNFWLWEYTENNQKYKSIGGKSFEEMQRDYPELNKGV